MSESRSGAQLGVATSIGTVEIKVLGGFEVLLDGVPVTPSAWPRPQASALVKVLALAPGRRLHREQLIDRLWPELTLAEAAPRVHKLAHYARRALGDDRSAVVLRGEAVALFPNAEVIVDADVFLQAADEALAAGTPAAASAAADRYGPLLPGDRYQAWTENPREHLRRRYRELLRAAARWDDLLADEPTDENAHVALMEGFVANGDHQAALRQFERMEAALRAELGVRPGVRALQLRDEIVAALPHLAGSAGTAVNLVGRRRECEQLDRLLADAGHGRGRTVLVSGAPGVGKSALLGWADGRAEQLGWKVGTGVAAAVEGAWSYAPILDAVADLCRRHPTLLDGLDETVQQEIERALAGNALVWSGEDTHQRLFVATAELLRHAASGSGLMLILDDMHESDEVSLRLLHYLARCMSRERALVVVGHRDGDRRIQQVKASLSRRNLTFELPLAPLDREATAELIRSRYPGSGDELVERIWAVSGGLPFAAAEMLAAPASGTAAPLGAIGLGRLSTKARGALQRVAVIGTHFDTDQFIALTGIPERDAFAALDAALAAQVIVHTGAGYRFRHTLIRDALLDEIPTAERRAFHHQAADRLAAIGAPSTRIAHHLIAAGRLVEAVPRAISAAEAEAAVGAYSDALALVDAVRDQARGPDRTKVLALRANLLAALGDRTTIDAYRAAIAVGGESDRPLLRARMAAAAIKEADMDTAAAILDGLEPDGGPADASVLLAKGSLAYLTGDIDEAARIADLAGRLAGPEENTWQRFDLVTLQAMIAHYRGEFFTRIRTELRRAQDDPVLASALFDPYLCVVEFLLYGTTPYREVVLLAESVRRTARRAGVLRAEAFATALLGEAALLSGDLAAAEHELGDAADLYREIAAPAGEASALQRLAEVRLFQGDRAEAGRLLSRALLRARWSMMALHLLQRIHGTMILAAPDPRLARTLVDRAEDAIGREDSCEFCDIMLAVPAAIACADVGDIADAERYLAAADRSLRLWEGTAWQGAILEARAHVAWAVGEPAEAAGHLDGAAHLFEQAGQPLDAERCRAKALAGPTSLATSAIHPSPG